MTVLIKGMEMPRVCGECSIRQRQGMNIVCPVSGKTFSVADTNILFYRLDCCPLVEVPTPHGRLIDAAVYRAEMKDRQDKCAEWRLGAKIHGSLKDYDLADQSLRAFIEAKLTLDKMPTVIESEG